MKDENKYYFEYDNENEHTKLIELATSMHSLVRRTFRSCDTLKREVNSIGV